MPSIDNKNKSSCCCRPFAAQTCSILPTSPRTESIMNLDILCRCLTCSLLCASSFPISCLWARDILAHAAQERFMCAVRGLRPSSSQFNRVSSSPRASSRRRRPRRRALSHRRRLSFGGSDPEVRGWKHSRGRFDYRMPFIRPIHLYLFARVFRSPLFVAFSRLFHLWLPVTSRFSEMEQNETLRKKRIEP